MGGGLLLKEEGEEVGFLSEEVVLWVLSGVLFWLVFGLYVILWYEKVLFVIVVWVDGGGGLDRWVVLGYLFLVGVVGFKFLGLVELSWRIENNYSSFCGEVLSDWWFLKEKKVRVWFSDFYFYLGRIVKVICEFLEKEVEITSVSILVFLKIRYSRWF